MFSFGIGCYILPLTQEDKRMLFTELQKSYYTIDVKDKCLHIKSKLDAKWYIIYKDELFAVVIRNNNGAGECVDADFTCLIDAIKHAESII